MKQQYIETIENTGWTLEEYKQILDDIDMKFPLTQEEISNAGKEAEQQIDMVELPNGVKIPEKQYEQEYTTEERTDMVELPNGIKIPKKQYEEEQGTKKQAKNISISDVKASISKGKVTTQENQNATQDMRKLMEIKRLQIMQRTGQILTPEQKQLLDEHIRQTNEAQVRFRNQQEQKKSNGLSL